LISHMTLLSLSVVSVTPQSCTTDGTFTHSDYCSLLFRRKICHSGTFLAKLLKI
jgi:hypothetical protein